MSGLIASLITVAAVLFWIRGVFVQLAAAQVSPRVVREHLSDRFAARSLAFLVGAFGYVVALLLVLPERGDAPALASLTAGLLAVGAFLTVVRTIEVGLRSSRTSALVLQLAGHAARVIRDQLPPAGQGAGIAVGEEGRGDVAILASSSGWVVGMDEPALLDALPPAAALTLAVAPGRLVTTGSVLGWTDAELEPHERDKVRQAITLGEQRPADDIDLALRELVDVVLQAMAPGAADAELGYEAMAALEWVLAELLARDLPPSQRREDGKRLLRVGTPSHEQRLRSTLVSLHSTVRDWPEPSRRLAEVTEEVAERLERWELGDRAGLVRRVAAEVLDRSAVPGESGRPPRRHGATS